MEKKNKAVFFDRDGTLNVDVDFLHKIEDFRWTPGATEAVKYANDNGYLVIVVTNQSGVARGYFGEDAVNALHAYMDAELKKQGAHIDAFYYCPYLKGAPVKEYDRDSFDRKPQPGMVLKAIADYGIDPALSLMVGDKPRDIECGEAAGIKGVLYKDGSLYELLKTALNELENGLKRD